MGDLYVFMGCCKENIFCLLVFIKKLFYFYVDVYFLFSFIIVE